MGLFYVWLKYGTYSGYTKNSRDLLTFVNREAADEWWRTISAPSYVHAGCVKRLSPQFYIQTQRANAHDFFDDISPTISLVSERMFQQYFVNNQERNQVSIIQSDEVTDHISGRWYFIRSKADPSSHWYLRTSGACAVCGHTNCDAIHVSRNYRTRFCVRVRNNPNVPEEFVMIGKDGISIAAPKGYVLYINNAEDLKATKGYQGEIDLLFSDLKNRFVTRAERQVNGEVWENVESVERGVGEPWELVGE